MIVFVGDQPSKKNICPSIPFVGTQSYKRLLEWMWKMDLDVTDVELANRTTVGIEQRGRDTEVFLDDIRWYYPEQIQLVALGNKASEHLKNLGLDHFKLPHPSGLNRKLNDEEWLECQLNNCKYWLDNPILKYLRGDESA